MEEYVKKFDEWNSIKKELGYKNKSKTIRCKQIWWASIGVNVGSEQDGKGSQYLRLIYVLKEINSRIFLCIPLTSKMSCDYAHVPFYFRRSFSTAILSQIKVLDRKRLQKKIGTTSDYLYEKMKKATVDFILD